MPQDLRFGLPTSLTATVMKEVLYALKQFRRVRRAYPTGIRVYVPGAWKPMNVGVQVDEVAFRNEVLAACAAACDNDLKAWIANKLRMDLLFDPVYDEVVVHVQQYKPVGASLPPFPVY